MKLVSNTVLMLVFAGFFSLLTTVSHAQLVYANLRTERNAQELMTLRAKSIERAIPSITFVGDLPIVERRVKRIPADYKGYAVVLVSKEKPLPNDDSMFRHFGNVLYDRSAEGNFVYLLQLPFSKATNAEEFMEKIVKSRYPDCRLVEYAHGEVKNTFKNSPDKEQKEKSATPQTKSKNPATKSKTEDTASDSSSVESPKVDTAITETERIEKNKEKKPSKSVKKSKVKDVAPDSLSVEPKLKDTEVETSKKIKETKPKKERVAKPKAAKKEKKPTPKTVKAETKIVSE